MRLAFVIDPVAFAPRASRRRRTGAALGAAMLATACGDSATSPTATELVRRELTPACTTPAPLQGRPDARLASRYIALFTPGVEPVSEVARLARVHRFTPTHVYLFATGGFAAELTPAMVAALRCEPTIQVMEYDQVVTIAGGGR